MKTEHYLLFQMIQSHAFTEYSFILFLVCLQTDYILGANPKGMSYMVGFGEKYPQKIHHRGSSLPSVQQKAQHFGCSDAFQSYYHSAEPNPNILIGAVVGGPDHNDEFKDDRDNFAQSEPATYINAPLVGTLTYLAANF